ncbi:hypothetical protein Prudu_007521, partial [Prunus dulcis]
MSGIVWRLLATWRVPTHTHEVGPREDKNGKYGGFKKKQQVSSFKQCWETITFTITMSSEALFRVSVSFTTL